MSSEDSSLDDPEMGGSIESDYREGGIALLFEDGLEELGGVLLHDDIAVLCINPGIALTITCIPFVL